MNPGYTPRIGEHVVYLGREVRQVIGWLGDRWRLRGVDVPVPREDLAPLALASGAPDGCP